MKNSFFYKILQLFYGELFNMDNSFPKRIMRILCRTPFKYPSLKLFNLFKKKNPELSTNSKLHFKNDLDLTKTLVELKKNGIYDDIILKDEIVKNILEKIRSHKFQINRTKNKIYLNEKKNFKDIYLLRLFNPHIFIMEIDEISLNKNLISIVKRYLGCEPIIISSQIWWTYPYYNESGEFDNPPGNEFGFHYDVDDFKFLKLFFYLNDVDNNCGPHVYVKNNGKKNIREYLNRRVEDNYVLKKYKDRVQTILGKAGRGFIEDTSFYHKGTNPKTDSGRGVLQIIYGIHRWE
jgi:hypothetical protein